LDTISAFETDIGLQPDLLKSFVPQAPMSENLQKKSIFCGSGDSLSAAMLAESFSDYAARSADPLDILKNRKISKNKRLYLVSVSGSTASNIRASKTASKSFAITAAKGSRLDRSCSKTILLDFPNSGVFTAGSIGFLSSALTCISLVSEIRLGGAGKILDSARRDAAKFRLSGNTFVLGNFLTYPVAMYCAAKLYEVLGSVSQYERTEQFSHMGLFSARPGDTVLLFEAKTPHARRLSENLKRLGLNVIRPKISGSRIQQVLHLIFFSQLLALNEARSKKLGDCHFVTAKKARDASSDMIY